MYKTDYVTLLNDFVQKGLGLTFTKVSDKTGDFEKYWDWKQNDAHLPTGAITSNILDMLSYAQMQLEKNYYFANCHKSIKTVNAWNKINVRTL